MNTNEETLHNAGETTTTESTVNAAASQQEQTVKVEENNPTDATPENEAPAEAKPARSLGWREVSIGGAAGIMLGAAAMAFASGTPAESVDDAGDPADADAEAATGSTAAGATSATHATGLVPEGATVDVATGVSDDMSFGQAFAAARQELGAGGVFVWHGNVYNTYTAEEWHQMSPAEHQEFAHQVSGTSMPEPEPHHLADDDHITPAQPEPDDDTLDVDLISVQETEIDGVTVTVGVGHVEGHNALMVDVDQDGVIDGIMVDVDDNGDISENEIIDVQEAGLTFADLGAPDAGGDALAQRSDLDPYADMPDYANDADVDSFA